MAKKGMCYRVLCLELDRGWSVVLPECRDRAMDDWLPLKTQFKLEPPVAEDQAYDDEYYDSIRVGSITS